MSTTNKRTRSAAVLGLTAVMSLGLAAVQIKPAEARHHRHYRVVDPYYTPYGYREDYGSTRWWRNHKDDHPRRNRFGDRDRDGIDNRSDRDIDGDGIPNGRDRHPFNPNRR